MIEVYTPSEQMCATPYRLRDGWYCMVAGKRYGPWRDKGAALAGYQTELRRSAKREKS